MRILYYSDSYGFPTTTFIRNEVNYFKKHHEIKYISRKVYGNIREYDFVELIPASNSLFQKILARLRSWDILFYHRDFQVSRKLKEAVESFNPDIIHCHFFVEALPLLDNIDFSRYPVVIHFHGYDATKMVRYSAYNRRLKQILSKPNVFVVSCNNNFITTLKRVTGTRLERSKVVYYGIDLDLFHPKKIEREEGKVFLQVSSLVEKKGHEFTLRAFAELLKISYFSDSVLILTGDGTRMPLLANLVEDLGIKDKVMFKGVVTPTQAVELMNKADVFVHHSITSENGDMEGIPNAIIEAMAMELPIVSTNHSGIPELVEDGVNGFLCNEKDIKQFAFNMSRAYKMGRVKENRTKVFSSFNMIEHNSQIENIYKKLIKSFKSGNPKNA